jgi:quinol monooxygenase YgiN
MGDYALSGQIQLTAQFHVEPENDAAFRQVVSEASNLVEQNEPKMLGYAWYSRGSEFTLIEQYASNDVILFHRDNAAGQRGKFQALSSVQVRVYGDVGEGAHAAYVAAGAEFHEHFAGFSRYQQNS